MLTRPFAVLALTLAALSAAAAAPPPAAPSAAPATALIPPPPPLTGRTSSIADAGAKADGATINTAAIQKAIDALATQGGGTLVIPAADGKAFLSGALFLKPGVNVRVEKGAILKGSTDIKDYPLVNTRIEGHFQEWVPALINAIECDSLKIDGEGTLDGSGTPFYAAFRAARGTNLGTPRPRLLFIQKSNGIAISGIHLLNSGFWNLHVYNCDKVEIDGLDIRAAAGSPSTDGIDVDSSRNVHINHTFISNNDDCIALKGSKGVDAQNDKTSPPVEHILVENCTFNMGGSIVTCGSEATFVRDVTVRNCTVKGTQAETRGLNVLRLKLRTDTPQTYEDIHFDNITLDGAGPILAFSAWTQYETIPPGVARPTHTVRNISLSNIKGTYGTLGSIAPNFGDTIENVTLENIDVKLTGAAPRIAGVKNFIVKNVKLNGEEYVPTVLPGPTAPPAGRGRGGAATAPAASRPTP